MAAKEKEIQAEITKQARPQFHPPSAHSISVLTLAGSTRKLRAKHFVFPLVTEKNTFPVAKMLKGNVVRHKVSSYPGKSKSGESLEAVWP